MNNIAPASGATAVAWGLFLTPLFFVFILWSVFWAALALWHAARRGQSWWFVAFLFVHTLGVLEIIYLFAVLKLKWSKLFSK